ncbi:hypothetical protein [Aliiroseovarius sp. Z3]|uniref:hypothetical protein n=1 Tax=Aliiroseovarius sp. Z3 TaxID=2811402 RepID=UPI0023B21443|nr:hypothetical protein [Aliiroseovarius sp. Z3]
MRKGNDIRIFSPEVRVHMMIGAMFPIAFTVPVLVCIALWPAPGESNLWKVTAILAAASSFVAMKAIFMYFSTREAQLSAAVRYGEDNQ